MTKKRQFKTFQTIEEARMWKQTILEMPLKVDKLESDSTLKGPIFARVAIEWKRRTYPSIGPATRVAYDKLVNIYMGSLMNLSIYEITPQRVDLWLDELTDPEGHAMKASRRRSFSHELSVLSCILRYYENYYDDVEFRYPIKQRHKDGIELNRPYTPKHKDLTEDQFLKFRGELKNGPYGETIAALATLQYHQALRVSEAAGLHWDDVNIEFKIPQQSRIKIVRAIIWPRKKGEPSFIKGGFKNSKSNGGVKEQPMFPETYDALMPLYQEGARGLIFHIDGSHLEYRTIQHAYDKAFKRACLPYSGTHVLRHGGCRKLLNETGDMTIAKQHLGNTDMKTVEVYARREASALTKVVHAMWDRKIP